jgi:hypothetical protein
VSRRDKCGEDLPHDGAIETGLTEILDRNLAGRGHGQVIDLHNSGLSLPAIHVEHDWH